MPRGILILSLILFGLVSGIIVMLAYDTSMRLTSTEEFCVSCHEMKRPLALLKTTAHFSNHSGVTASCGDCHIPHNFVPKIIRKAQAAREVYGHFIGIIDTPEKYEVHRDVMRQREISRIRASDSAECRHCHQPSRMNQEEQSNSARKKHREVGKGKSCIDCHEGIAHPLESEDETGFDL